MDLVDAFKVIYRGSTIRPFKVNLYSNPSFKDSLELIVLRANQTLAISMDSKSMENVNAMNLFRENFAMK